MIRLLLPLFAFATIAAPLPVADLTRSDRVSFQREILPILQANCLPCHNQTRAKGDLVLETPEAMIRGGASGTALVPGRPAESLVFQASTHQAEDLVMPPSGNKVNARDLSPMELALLSLWISQGATADAAPSATLAWQALPPHLVSSFAVAIAPDSQTVAVARGNRIFLYQTNAAKPFLELSDPALAGAAQRDWVNALAFSPNGDWLAAAGYREVRLWRRTPVLIEEIFTGSATNIAGSTSTNDLPQGFHRDPRRTAGIADLEDELALSRAELARATHLVSETEKSIKSSDEALKKAREKREEHQKVVAEKEKELATHSEAESAATNELNRIATELQRFEDAFAAASQELAEARMAATSATGNLAPELERLESRAFAAGERKAELTRAQTDLPPLKKQAEERLAAARKSLDAARPQVAKARITLDGSTQDVALAEKSLVSANEALAAAQSSAQLAQKRIAETESALAQTTSAPSPALVAAAQTSSGWLVAREDASATFWDNTSGQPVNFQLPTRPLTLATLNNHSFLAVLSNAVLRLSISPAWSLARTIGSPDSPGDTSFADRVNALAFSPDGALLATGGGEPSRAGELKLWRVEDGALVRDLGGIHSDTVMSLAFSPRGERLASAGADRFARVTSLSDSAPQQLNFEGHTHHVLAVAWSADGATLATAGAEGTVKLWNALTGERRANVENFGKEVTSIHRLGATDQFVAISGSGQGRLFRASGEKVRDLDSASAYLQAAAITRQGTVLVAGADNGVAFFWDLSTGKRLNEFKP